MLVEVVADFIMHGSHAKSRSQSDGMKSTSMRNLSRSCWHVMLWATWGLTTQPQQVRATVEMTLCLNALSQRREVPIFSFVAQFEIQQAFLL